MTVLLPAGQVESTLRHAHGHLDRSVVLLRAAVTDLANTTPEPDCAIDWLEQIAADSLEEELALYQLRRALVRSGRRINLGRIDTERGDIYVLGLASDMHALRLASASEGKAPSAKTTAARLRPILGTLARSEPPCSSAGEGPSFTVAQLHALRDLARVARECGHTVLRSPSLRHAICRADNARAQRVRDRRLAWLDWFLAAPSTSEAALPGGSATTTGEDSADHAC